MTSPDMHDPGSRENPGAAGEDIIKKLAGGFFNGGAIFEHIAGNIADALNGLFAGQDGALGEISDGQIGLANEMELLQDVRGFCAAYQSKNVNCEWAWDGNNTRDLPFSGAVLDHPKGAHIEGNGIVFDDTGLWVIYCVARARNTGFTGGAGVSLFVDVVNADGSLYSSMIFDSAPGPGFATVGGSIPVLISEPGQYVRVRAWSDRWRWWDGGMRYARLAVVKVDSSDNTNPPNTVPDETEEEVGGEGQTLSAPVTTRVDAAGVMTYHDPYDSEEDSP